MSREMAGADLQVAVHPVLRRWNQGGGPADTERRPPQGRLRRARARAFSKPHKTECNYALDFRHASATFTTEGLL
jgi:hypothetical protein